MMMKLVVALACAFALAHALPPPGVTRNTIFAEERFQGEVFENAEAFTNIELHNEIANPYRLPTTTKPIHYNVNWDINIERLSYSGSVRIQLVATQPGVNEIVIHSHYTELSNIRLTQGSNSIDITDRRDPQYHFLIIRPSVDLEYNATSNVVYTLSIDFSAEMRSDMYGIYQSWFKTNSSDPEPDPESGISWMASTQFQATAARYAFPCYDEPSFKAKFDITIRRPTSHKSWSCTTMKIGNDTIPPVGEYTIDEYHTTPEMSTYLLALIVADYDSNIDAVNEKYEVIGRVEALYHGKQGDYAVYTGEALLAKMSAITTLDFYDMDDNLKMTQAAIPDFSAGAMENWGLLTYREAYLFADEDDTNIFYIQFIASILSHEIAHMWFGNLVTCDWWDVLWLNEGFARYYQYFLPHMVETEMEFETRFVVEQVHTALLADSADNAHPLTNRGVGSPQAVSAMFSTITYNKGASIIRQTDHFLGSEVHTRGLINYLKERSFETAKPIDLFVELEKVAIETGALEAYGSQFNFIEYYKSWTEQPGHPLLSVNVNHATGRMTITQHRFSINTGLSNVPTNYIVPITFASVSDFDFNNTKPSHVLTDSVTIIDRGSVGNEWVIFNKQQTGFYRVNYDDYTWGLIALALRGSDRTRIHECNRAQIVNDLFQFARSGLMSYNRAFNILAFLENETVYAPWFAAITGFNWLRNRLASSPDQLLQLNEVIIKWANTVMTQLSYMPRGEDTWIQKYLRYQLAPLMCAMGVPACRTAARTQFEALKANNTPVPVDNRNWVYCNALRDGTTSDFDFLWERFLTHNVYTEKIVLLQSLGCTPHNSSLYQFLNAIVVENFEIRPQDYTTAFSSAVNGNEENTMIVFAYIQDHLKPVTEAFNSATTPLSYISSRLRNEEQVLAFQTWVNESRVDLGDDYQAVYNNANSALESIQWVEEVSSDLNDYFTGDDIIFDTTTSSSTTTEVIPTITPGPLVEPTTPEFPDSAVSTAVSLILLSLGVIVHWFF